MMPSEREIELRAMPRVLQLATEEELSDELVRRGWSVEFDTGGRPEPDRMLLVEPEQRAMRLHRARKSKR